MTSKKEYICTYCGIRQTTFDSFGRPASGECRAKGKTRDGKMKPHSWRISRKY